MGFKVNKYDPYVANKVIDVLARDKYEQVISLRKKMFAFITDLLVWMVLFYLGRSYC